MKLTAERKIIIGLALAVWIFLVAIAAIYWNTRHYIAAQEAMPRIEERLRRLKDILLVVGQTEADERSYLLTGDPAALAPSRAALGKLEPVLQRLEAPDNAGAESIAEVRELLTQRAADLTRLETMPKEDG